MRAFGEYLKGRRGHMAAVAASHLDPERVTRIVLGCVARTPKLAQCTTASIVRSVMQAVELGLEPGSATGQAYLVPFGQDCTLVIGYRGLLDLMRRTGQVASVNAQAVYEGDEFELAFGIEDTLRHVPKGDPDPARLIGAYAVVRFRDGSHQLGYMTRKQIDAIRSRSRAGNSGPWVTDYAEMARKTVLRNVAKWCPMSIEMSKALAADVAADTGDASGLVEFETADAQDIEGEVVDEPAPEPAGTSRLRNRLKAATSEPASKPVASDATTAAGNSGSAVWAGPGLCPGCHAPSGRIHASRCTRPAAEAMESPTESPTKAEEPDPFSAASATADDSTMPGSELASGPPDPPPYDRMLVGTHFAGHAAALGVLARSARPGEITALRNALLPELGEGGTWRDITEEQYGLLMARLAERAQ